MRRSGLVLLLALVLVASLAPFLAQPARALTWTQTSEADFLAGSWSNLDILPSGDLRLAGTPGWSKEGVVLDVGSGNDGVGTSVPCVLKDGATYHMWYRGYDGSRNRILHATSTDGVSWTRQGVAIDVLVAPHFFDSATGQVVLKEGSTFKMWFHGGFWSGPFGLSGRIYYATSSDAVSWTIVGVALDMGPAGAWDAGQIGYPSVTRDGGGTYWLYYSGWDGTTTRLGVATSTTGVTFAKYAGNPVLGLGPAGSWDGVAINAPFVGPSSPRGMLYSGIGTLSRIGVATSPDGFAWTKDPRNPVFSEGAPGAWDDNGVASPSGFVDGTSEYLYYAGHDGSTLRIGRAKLATLYEPSGWFESAVLDTGSRGTRWTTLFANGTVNLVSAMFLRTRTGDTPLPDGTWSPWSAAATPGTSIITSPRARYLQVRAELATASSVYTPVLSEFSVAYELNGAATPTPTSPVGGAWVTPSGLRLTWAYSDPEGDSALAFQAQVSGRLDFATIEAESGVVLSTNTSWRSPPVNDGGWYWRVQTMDAFGRWSPFSAPALARVDGTAPATMMGFSLPPGSVGELPQLDSSNRILLTGTDSGSGVSGIYYTVSGGPQTPYSGPFRPAVHGIATVRVWSVDAVGNAENPKSFDLLFDDAPTAAPASPEDEEWTNSSRVTLGWTYSDPEGDPPSAFEVQITDDPSFNRILYTSGIVSGAGTAYSSPGIADGTYLWRVRVADAFGTWSAFSTARTISIDTGLPAVTHAFSGTLGSVKGQIWIATGTLVTLTANDGGSGIDAVHYSIDGVSAEYAGPVALSTHGPHTLEYWAQDSAGNAGGFGRVEFLIDLEPQATSLAPSDQAWLNGPPSLAWTFSDPDDDLAGGYEVVVSTDPSYTVVIATSGIVESGGSSWEAPTLAEGSYFWRVRVGDEFGVWSLWSATSRVRIDTTAPAVSARYRGTAVPSGVFSMVSGESVELIAEDAGSGVATIEFSLDGGPWIAYSGPLYLNDPGRHFLAFRARDAAGNLGATQFAPFDVVFPINWTPVLAGVLAVILAVLGVVMTSRKRGEVAVTGGLLWALLAGPATALEAAIGVYSLLTGDLAIPPWLGTGLALVAATAVGGFTELALALRVVSRLTARTT